MRASSNISQSSTDVNCCECAHLISLLVKLALLLVKAPVTLLALGGTVENTPVRQKNEDAWTGASG